MPTLEDRNQSIADYVEAYTGRGTFISESGFAQPEGEYCTVKLIVNIPYHHEVKRDIDGVTEETRGLRKLTYSVKAIGGDVNTGATAALHRLQSSFEADVPRRTLTDQEIGILETGEVTDISILVGSRIEDRAFLNITFSASMSEIFDYESAIESEIEIDPGVEPAQTLTVPTDPPECPV